MTHPLLDPQKVRVKSKDLGFYFTLKFNLNYSSSSYGKLPFNTDEIYTAAQRKMNEEIRNTKFPNPIIKVVYILLMFLSAIGGFFLSVEIGLVVTLLFSLILSFLNPFSSGKDKAF